MVSAGFAALSLLLLLVLVGAGRPQPQSVTRIHPLLVTLASEQPEQSVAVIVQKSDPDARIAEAVTALGGQVTKDLRIINAVAAELKAKDAMQLSQLEGVRWVSPDAPTARTGGPDGTVNTSKLLNTYNRTVGVDKVWAEGYQGSGVTVAVVDSGVASHDDLFKKTHRILASVQFNSNSNNTFDWYGHGTHVAGIIGGDGTLSNGQYIGMAPKVNLVSVKVSDDNGVGTTSDLINGLQWVLDNRVAYNIKVVNLSLNSSINQSYHVDPVDAAVEVLWFNKIVVVVSAGNDGKGALYPPANDPFVITVGAVDEKGTSTTNDDSYPKFTTYGTTVDGFMKPEIAAPGVNIISTIASSKASLAKNYPANLAGSKPYHYFRMSGTSMAAPIVAATAALMLQAQPNLNPDQIKQCITATAKHIGNSKKSTWGMLNTYNAVHCDYASIAALNDGARNAGIAASRMLWTGSNPVTWNSVNWSSVNWSSVNWSSVNWSSVNWSSVNWASDDWSY